LPIEFKKGKWSKERADMLGYSLYQLDRYIRK